MNPSLVIAKKRDGGALSTDEIAAFVDGYVRGEIPDYQMSALAMAVFFRGMDSLETAALTERMLRSGTTLEWSDGTPAKVDKHSTGGVGDKVSLVLAPLLACCGLQVPMISGRGLGATGGTLDKLESIPGFRTDLVEDEIRQITESVGCMITGATVNLVPADRKLYALRDVTATVASIPLITASIMSKKLAEGLSALVLDVKYGSGAFMKSLDDARALARSLVQVGNSMGTSTVALVTDMNQPLGRTAGGAVEVDESIAVLSGDGPADLAQLVIALGAELLLLTRTAETTEEASKHLGAKLRSGDALAKFREMVTAQGGNMDKPRPVATPFELTCRRAGYVAALDTERLGVAVVELGGGRKKLGDAVDHSVGLEMLVRLGEKVERGQPWIRLFGKSAKIDGVTSPLESALRISDDPPPECPLIVERIT